MRGRDGVMRGYGCFMRGRDGFMLTQRSLWSLRDGILSLGKLYGRFVVSYGRSANFMVAS
jgi:hypothetical protein